MDTITNTTVNSDNFTRGYRRNAANETCAIRVNVPLDIAERLNPILMSMAAREFLVKYAEHRLENE